MVPLRRSMHEKGAVVVVGLKNKGNSWEKQ
jgi:hypothetical protein